MYFILKGKELPTFKDMDFRNNMQKVYVTEEQKEKFMEKLNRDVEVGELCIKVLLLAAATGWQVVVLSVQKTKPAVGW